MSGGGGCLGCGGLWWVGLGVGGGVGGVGCEWVIEVSVVGFCSGVGWKRVGMGVFIMVVLGFV